MSLVPILALGMKVRSKRMLNRFHHIQIFGRPLLIFNTFQERKSLHEHDTRVR